MIRRARLWDLPAIVKIGREAFPYIKNPLEFFFRRIFSGYVYVYESEGKVVGFVDFELDGGEGVIQGIAVDRPLRGRGIGKELLTHALRVLSRLGVKKVRLMTLSSNIHAVNLYKSAGFVPVSSEGNVLHFEKDL